jgi:hypothetical protein
LARTITVKQQLMILKDNTDTATDVWHLTPGYPIQIGAVDEDLTLAGPFHQHNQLHQGALPGPGMTCQKSHLARIELKADAR